MKPSLLFILKDISDFFKLNIDFDKDDVREQFVASGILTNEANILNYNITQDFVDEFIDEMGDKIIDHYVYTNFKKLSDDFIIKNRKKININSPLQFYYISDNVLENCLDVIKQNILFSYKKVELDFIIKHADKLDWNLIAINQNHVPIKMLFEHADVIDWKTVFSTSRSRTTEIVICLLEEHIKSKRTEDNKMKPNVIIDMHTICGFNNFKVDFGADNYVEQFVIQAPWNQIYYTKLSKEFIDYFEKYFTPKQLEVVKGFLVK